MRKLLIVFAFLVATAHAQFCTGYTKEYTLTVQAGAITGTLANYTMLVSGTYAYLGVGGPGFATSTNGYDITFNIAGVATTWNMPIYNSGTGQVKANVLIPSATVGAKVSMCVGNAAVTTFQGGTTAYDSSTKMALQFPNAAFLADSAGQQTLTNHNGATHTSTGPTYLIDSLTLNGTNQYLDIGATPGFPTGFTNRTISLWVNPTTMANDPAFVEFGSPSSFGFYTTLSQLRIYIYDSATNRSTGTLTAGVWQRVDVGYNSGNNTLYFYLNGVPAGSVPPPGGSTPNTSPGSGALSAIGRLMEYSNYLGGQMADVRVSNVFRGDVWIAAEYLNQSNPAVFYAIALVNPPPLPVLSAVSIIANSPLSVKATWTTDIPTDSQVQCGTVSGTYTFNSSVVNANPNWNVTAHSMASNPMPNGSYYCRVKVVSAAGGVGYSAEQSVVALPAMPASQPIAMVNPSIKLASKLGDRYAGTNGAPLTGIWSFLDNGYGCWADDNIEYFFMPVLGAPGPTIPSWNGGFRTLRMEYVKFADAQHTTATRLATAWQNGMNNSAYNTFSGGWLGTPCISVNGNMYVVHHDMNMGNPTLTKTTDHFQSTIDPRHNVGQDTTYITGMICDSTPAPGTIHATSKLNVTDELPILIAPASMAIFITGAIGTGVNGVFGPVTTATATNISWQRDDGTSAHTPITNCTGWTYIPTGGTGNGGGMINVYGWDTPSSPMVGGITPQASWIQNDGPDYVNGTKWAGMDAFVYWHAASIGSGLMGLARMRVEDMVNQDWSKVGYYIGHQIGDDGIYDSNWDYTHAAATTMNAAANATRGNGKGAPYPQTLYLTALNRYVVATQIAGFTDSVSGGTAIYDGGLYPWSAWTLIGNAQRNTDSYAKMGSGPEFPQFVAKSQTSANGITTVSLEHNGGNYGVDIGNPTANTYDTYMSPGVQFVAKVVNVTKSSLAPGEAASGMDLAYNFDVFTGSLSMPNAAPADAQQKWAWKTTDNRNSMYTDQYGSFLHSLPAGSSAGGLFPTTSIQNIAFVTPYVQALPGALTVLNCFGHYPSAVIALPDAGAIALSKGSDLSITWNGAKGGARATATVSGGSVTGFVITVPGNVGGYTSAPVVTIGGTTGVQATATAVLGTAGTAGQVVSITITNAGTLYGAPPSVTISSGTVSAGGVTSLSVGIGGRGYTVAPTVTINGNFTSAGATATASLTGDVLTSITVNTPGTNYPPSITVSISEPTKNWAVNLLGTFVGNISLSDNSIGCAVVRRDSSNRVNLYTSAGIGKSLPLVSSATATVAGPWTTAPLVIGDGASNWGSANGTPGNSFWGIESLLRVWSRDLADDELLSEMAAIRGVLWSRGKGSSIP